MTPMQAQDAWRLPITAVAKGSPTKIALGAVNASMPAAYRGSGLQVIVRQTGWASLDGRTIAASAWSDGTATLPPYLVLPVDTSGQTGANPPRADGYVSIPQTLPNFARYPAP